MTWRGRERGPERGTPEPQCDRAPARKQTNRQYLDFRGIALCYRLESSASSHMPEWWRLQVQCPESSRALDFWYRAMKHGRFATFAELRATFGGVDKVGPLLVFNIGGNKLPLIAAVHFNSRKVFVRHVLSHAEYDRSQWKRKEVIQ